MITAAVGQKVTVLSGSTSRNVPLRVLTVAARTKLKIRCGDGSEWKTDGRRWGWRDPWYTGENLVDHEPEHDTAISRAVAVQKAKRAVERIAWGRLSADDARAIAAALEPFLQMEKT